MAGKVYDFNNVYVETGASITIVGNTIDFTQIGIAGDFTLKGNLYARGNIINENFVYNIAPDCTQLSVVSFPRDGGRGGNGGGTNRASGGQGFYSNSGSS